MIKRIFKARLEKDFFRRMATGEEVKMQAKSNRLGKEGFERGSLHHVTLFKEKQK
jgi:hypothetical protein